MEARSVVIHQVQFSSFFLFISHMPVNAAAEVKLSAMGTVLSVKRLSRKYKMTQQLKKKIQVFLQSRLEEAVTDKADFPSVFFDHITQPATLMTV